MKSTKINVQSFSMEDFEEGLMLAGYVTPASPSEERRREALRSHEKDLSKANSILFFKRVTLAAEIASQLHNEPTFGRVKFQKVVYLCEHAAEMNLDERYSKQAAGPFDNKFMHSIEKEFKKNKWFDVQKVKSGTMTRSVYVPLDKVDGYKKYYDSYYSNTDEKIQHIIELLRKLKTDVAEIAATLYACEIELRNENKDVNKEDLLIKFYNWSDKKGKFSQDLVLKTWVWMKEKGISTITS